MSHCCDLFRLLLDGQLERPYYFISSIKNFRERASLENPSKRLITRDKGLHLFKNLLSWQDDARLIFHTINLVNFTLRPSHFGDY